MAFVYNNKTDLPEEAVRITVSTECVMNYGTSGLKNKIKQTVMKLPEDPDHLTFKSLCNLI